MDQYWSFCFLCLTVALLKHPFIHIYIIVVEIVTVIHATINQMNITNCIIYTEDKMIRRYTIWFIWIRKMGYLYFRVI